MKTIYSILFLFFSYLSLAASPYDFNRYFIDASEKVKPSVVNIIAYTKKIHNGNTMLVKNAYGTGTIISSDGFIVTNNHLVKGSNYFQVIDFNGNRYDIQKLFNNRYYISDSKTDLAVIKIFTDRVKLHPIKVADSGLLVEGEWVIAVGNPYGLKQSITAGIVSSKGRDNIGFTDIEDFIQTDVSINPGNSGGPLVNLYGEMVGINTAIRTESGGFQGISFSIPSNIVKRVCSDLISCGRVKRGWLGFIAAEKAPGKGNSDRYIEIISVLKNSPSEQMGIIAGDIVREIDGTGVRSLGALVRIVGSKRINSRIEITVSRNGRLRKASCIMREKSDYFKLKKGMNYIFEKYGIEGDENSDGSGVIMTYVSPRSRFNQLKRGDQILSINGYRILNLEYFVEMLSKMQSKTLKIEFQRESGIYEVEIFN